MENFVSEENFEFFLSFAVPGIIAVFVRSQFTNGKMPSIAEGMVAYVAFSIVYQSLIFPFFGEAYLGFEPHGISGLFWFFVVIIIPAIIGGVLGFDGRKQWSKKILRKIGIITVDPIGCAWDWKFGNCKESWIIAVLKDGTKWAGVLGESSFISSDINERDIFIEQVYEIDSNNEWHERQSSVWLAHGEIQSVEFWPKS